MTTMERPLRVLIVELLALITALVFLALSFLWTEDGDQLGVVWWVYAIVLLFATRLEEKRWANPPQKVDLQLVALIVIVLFVVAVTWITSPLTP